MPVSYLKDSEGVMEGTEVGSDVAADTIDLGIKSGVNVVGKVMIMLDCALTIAEGGESGVASEPGARPGIGEEPPIELGVDSIPVVFSVPGPNLYPHTDIIRPKIMGPTCMEYKEETIERKICILTAFGCGALGTL